MSQVVEAQTAHADLGGRRLPDASPEADSVGGTSTTCSPAANSCCASSLPNPVADGREGGEEALAHHAIFAVRRAQG